jgi:cardiolipin synthase A/B
MTARRKRDGSEGGAELAAAADGPSLSRGELIGGNRVTLLVDGEEAYPAMLDAIARARLSVLMDSYIFNDDAAGRLFAAALMERARAGVPVHLTIDGFGTLGTPRALFDEMRAAGVAILEYRPVAPWRVGWGVLRRNHRKLLVVDGRVGFAGGINIGDQWLPREQGGRSWHDIHLRLEGPAVRALARISLSTWRAYAGVRLNQKVFAPDAAPAGSVSLMVIGSRERKNRKSIRRAYLHAIRAARHTLYIANAYFVPDGGIRRALRNAVRRGVDVRVMVPERGDILPVQLASQALYDRALKAGLRVFLWQDAVLHAKTAVIDGAWATVGSFNLDHRSWAMNLEVNVNVMDAEFAQQLRSAFERDQARCIELTLEGWRARPLWRRVVERFFFLFHRWM